MHYELVNCILNYNIGSLCMAFILHFGFTIHVLFFLGLFFHRQHNHVTNTSIRKSVQMSMSPNPCGWMMNSDLAQLSWWTSVILFATGPLIAEPFISHFGFTIHVLFFLGLFLQTTQPCHQHQYQEVCSEEHQTHMAG